MKRNFIFLFCIVTILGPSPALAASFWHGERDITRINSHLGVGVVGFHPMYFEQPYLGWQAYRAVRPSGARYFIPVFESRHIGFEVNAAFVDLTDGRGIITVKAQARYLETGPINFNGGAVVETFGWRYD